MDEDDALAPARGVCGTAVRNHVLGHCVCVGV